MSSSSSSQDHYHDHGRASSSGRPDRHRFTRSAHGCLTCRRAKVKCDEHEPACLRCTHLRRACVWPSAEQIAHPRRPKRRSKTSDSTQDQQQHAPPLSYPRPRADDDDDATVRAMTEGPSAALANSLLAKRRAAARTRTPTTAAVAEAVLVQPWTQQPQPASFELHGFDMQALANASEDELAIRLGPLAVPALAASPADDDAEMPWTAPHDMKSAFPSPLSSQLFHHFCASTSRILVTMGNRREPNPILSTCTPTRILDLGSAAAAALRMSVMSISVAHLANDAKTDAGRMQGAEGPRWQAIIAAVEAQSRRLRSAALASVVLAEEDLVDLFDTILATCVLVMIRDVVTAQPGWEDNVECAIRLVTKRDGPRAVLREESSNFARRFLLENLATHDVFGCFATQHEPAPLNEFDVWWYAYAESSRSEWEWESVERTFGVSRGMVELIARVRGSVLSRCLHLLIMFYLCRWSCSTHRRSGST